MFEIFISKLPSFTSYIPNDPQVGQRCDGVDLDFCENGIIICSFGIKTCFENDPGNIEICGNEIDDDCDGLTDEPECSPG